MPRHSIIDPRDTHSQDTALVTDFTKTEDDTGIPVWQKAGSKLLDEVLTASEVLHRSGNDFKVKTVPAYAKVGDVYVPAPDQKMVVREDTNVVLGTVGNKYKVIQNEDQIAAISPLVDSGFAKYDTAGLIYGGQIGWVMLKLNDEIALANSGDKVVKYLMALWSHNGASSFRIFPAPMRAFCANVLNSLLASAKNGINIRHTSSADQRIKEASRVIEASQGFYKDFEARANSLVTTPMTDKQMESLTEHLFPAKENADGDVKVSTRSQNIRDTMMNLFVHGAGHERVRGTAWAGYNAVAEYADHHRATRVGEDGDTGESRLASTMWGSGNQIKTKAINYIDKVVIGGMELDITPATR